MAKNIVVFSDGTGQEGGKGNNTNVYKLFNLIRDRSREQVAFYDRGLGTGWRKVTGNVAGAGMSKNILECYEFLFDEFESGDRIFLFGFSRGATTVRSLSGFLHLFGILPKSRRELIEKAYDLYRIKDRARRERKAKAFVRKHHTMWARVNFLGVWDTVAALGLPFKGIDVLVDRIPGMAHSFHDLRLSPSVEAAYHALAIDDERLTFHPTLWEPELESHQTMRQVWFSGMHTDVGGGYAEHELSDIALEWMVAQAQRHGLLMQREFGERHAPDADGHMHDSRGSRLTRFYRRKVRDWNASKYGPPVIHASVLLRTLNRDNQEHPPYRPWILSRGDDYEVEPWERHEEGTLQPTPPAATTPRRSEPVTRR
jgi:uncharacterized protein (DUF2235 family)